VAMEPDLILASVFVLYGLSGVVGSVMRRFA